MIPDHAAPYVVETIHPECDCLISDGGCSGHAPLFLVVRPDGLAIGATYRDEWAAEELASDLNEAWRAGFLAADDPNTPALWRTRSHR